MVFRFSPKKPNVLSKEWDDDRLSHPDVDHMLRSFRWIRCSFTYFSNPSHHYLHSLRAFPQFGHHRFDWHQPHHHHWLTQTSSSSSSSTSPSSSMSSSPNCYSSSLIITIIIINLVVIITIFLLFIINHHHHHHQPSASSSSSSSSQPMSFPFLLRVHKFTISVNH